LFVLNKDLINNIFAVKKKTKAIDYFGLDLKLWKSRKENERGGTS
jgi:hypothetical protein